MMITEIKAITIIDANLWLTLITLDEYNTNIITKTTSVVTNAVGTIPSYSVANRTETTASTTPSDKA